MTYRQYIWIYKEDYTQELLNQRLKSINERFDYIKKPVVCLDEYGTLINRYNSITEGHDDMLVDRQSLYKHLKRKKNHNTCLGYVWMYEDDYKLRRNYDN